MIQKTCAISGQTFQILPEDLAFYERFGVGHPSLCPDERMRRRMAWRNELNLYQRKCDATGKSIVSIFDPSGPFKVYSQEHWWSDNWDRYEYGQDFDFNRPFFEQFKELQLKVPRICLLSKNSENSEYTNHAADNKDCYMSSITFICEQVFYSRKVFMSSHVVDCDFIFSKGEQLYNCFFGENLYHCIGCVTCFNSSNLNFCIDCRGSRNCFMSSNLRNKEYVFYNQQLTKEAYEAKMRTINLGSYEAYQNYQKHFERLRIEETVYPMQRFHQCENCHGDFLANCKDCYECYFSSNAEEVRYCCDFDASSGMGNKSCMDCYGFGGSELIYEVQGQSNGYNNIATSWSYDVKDSQYLDMCHNTQNCLGCVGLIRGKNIIFNKAYTVEKYEKLSKKIIQHMKETGEWGEFFPIAMSPFPYNETMAQRYFPLTKEEALKRGYKWKDETQNSPDSRGVRTEIKSEFKISDDIKDVSDDILNQTLYCSESGRPYRIQKSELKFYRQLNLPIPRTHPTIRHQKRLIFENPQRLWDRTCYESGKPGQSSYSPDRPEKILSQDCYLKAVQ